MCRLFFFQAEDGIRDTSVTGVQTCALPICAQLVRPADGERPAQPSQQRRHPVEALGAGTQQHPALDRSEERRVGKECTPSEAANHYTKKHSESILLMAPTQHVAINSRTAGI